MARTPRGLLITGASSSIGAARARRYAAPGSPLTLTGLGDQGEDEATARRVLAMNIDGVANV